MAYAPLDHNALDHLLPDYQNHLHNAQNENDPQLQSLGTRIEEQLNIAIRKAAGYFQQHQQKANQWHTKSTTALKAAKEAVAEYKKDPEKQSSARLKNQTTLLRTHHNSIVQDQTELGQAWAYYRALQVPPQVPAKYTELFVRERSKALAIQQRTLLQTHQIEAMLKEAEALDAIAEKAYVKLRVKKGANNGYRSVPEARRLAEQASQQLGTLLHDLKHPGGATPQPAAITTGAHDLGNWSLQQAFPTNHNDLEHARHTWATTETAYKTMTTRKAAMEKVLAARTKGFRTNELADENIQTELRSAQQKVTDAGTEIANVAQAYANAKKAVAAIETKAKKKGIK